MKKLTPILLMLCWLQPGTLLAQKNLVPTTSSTLTQIALPPGTKEDKRLLVRAAAKELLSMEAKAQGLQLGNQFEIFLLPPATNGDASAFIVQAAQAQGWKLGQHSTNRAKRWGWMEKQGRMMIIHVETDNTGNYLYLAEVKGKPPLTDSLVQTSTIPQLPAANPAPVIQPDASPKPPATNSTSTTSNNSNPAGSYHYATTNFDDGWTAYAKPDWVELKKGNITVLIHLANSQIKMEEGQTPVLNAIAWDVLVAPRYTGKSNFYSFAGTISYMRSSAIAATLTNAQGQSFYVVLFRRGGGPFMEFICPNKETFIQTFGVDISPANERNLLWSDDQLWMALDNMQFRNKFAVAATDLPGYWSNTSTSALQMYYTGSGNYAGMNATAVSTQFWMEKNGSYRSMHKGASGMVGSQQIFQQEYKGRYQVTSPWEVSFTNRHNGKTESFWCQFTITRQGRLLLLTNKEAAGIQYLLTRNP